MKKLVLVGLLGAVLTGCGGGGGGDKDGNSDSSNTTVPSVNPTAILGSVESVSVENKTIKVNALTYQVANIDFKGTALSLDTIHQGMMVQLNTKTSQNKSSNKMVSVQLEPTMTGRIESVSSINGITTFSLNGVTLTATDQQMTSNDNEPIEVGDWVMVSSLPTADAGYKVLSVVKFDVDEYPTLADHVEIEGRIASINHNNSTLVLGSNITVYFGTSGLPSKATRGSWVEVEGTIEAGYFSATEIEIDGYDSNENDDIEGIITSVENKTTATPSFTLNFRGSFATDSSTCFKLEDSRCDSTLKNKLREGIEVEVTSTVKSGVRVASIVEFEEYDVDNSWANKEFECEGFVANFNQSKGSFTIDRCENDHDQVISSSVLIDALTRYEDLSQSDKENMNGLKVEVEGIIINNQNIAREIELED